MSKFVLPLILIIAAAGLFVVYTNPTYQGIKALQVQESQDNDALNSALQLRVKREQLLATRNSFAQSDLDKLQKILPDNVDNIRLIIDVNNIATRHGLSLSNLKLGTPSTSSTDRSNSAVGSTGDPVGSLDLGFSVTSNYDTFIAFLQDLEHSERIVDVRQLAFKASTSGGDSNIYDITFRTYWLH